MIVGVVWVLRNVHIHYGKELIIKPQNKQSMFELYALELYFQSFLHLKFVPRNAIMNFKGSYFLFQAVINFGKAFAD